MEVAAAVVGFRNSVLLLSVNSGPEFRVLMQGSLLKVELEIAVGKLREDTLDVLLGQGECLNVFDGYKAEFSHLVVEHVVLSEQVLAEQSVGEFVLLRVYRLSKELEPSSHFTRLDEVHL